MEQEKFNEIKQRVLEKFDDNSEPIRSTFNDAEMLAIKCMEGWYRGEDLEVGISITRYAYECARNEMEESIRNADTDMFEVNMFLSALALAKPYVEELKNYEHLQLKMQDSSENSR